MMHLRLNVTVTFVLFSFSRLGHFGVRFSFVLLSTKSPVVDRLGSGTWPEEAELRDPTGRTQATRSASSNLSS